MLLKRGRIGKKAQAEKVFIYAVTLIIVGMLLLFGYQAIAKLMKTSESATMAKFKNDIRNKIDVGSAYGRISTEDFETSVNFKAICFVTETAAANEDFREKYPLGADVAESQDNVFLYDGKTIDPFKIDPFEIDDNPETNVYAPDALCVPIQNSRFSIRIEGLGDRTLISS